jgi:DNA-binding Lrp family transcriptional regulator
MIKHGNSPQPGHPETRQQFRECVSPLPALAKLVNLSEAACSERVKRLREQGVITGFTTQLDPRMLDQGLLVFIEIKIDHTSPEAFDTFAKAIRSSPRSSSAISRFSRKAP